MAANGTAEAKTSTDGTATASQGTSDDKSPSLENLVPVISDAPKGQVTLGPSAGAFGPWRGHKIIDSIAGKIATATVTLLSKGTAAQTAVPAGPGTDVLDVEAVLVESGADVPGGPVEPEEPGADVPGGPMVRGMVPASQEAARSAPTEAVPDAGELTDRTEALSARILVVNDRLLLPGDWSAGYVHSSLCRLEKRLAPLSGRLKAKKDPLNEAIANIRTDEAGPPPAQEQTSIGGRTRGGPAPGISGVSPQPAASVPSVLSGAFGDAVNLLGLLRTDYTVTAIPVTAAPSELSTLTAARLAEAGKARDSKAQLQVTVEADAFTTLGVAPSVVLLDKILGLRDDAVDQISELQAILVPVQAELTAIGARAAALEQGWAALVAGKEGDPVIAQLQAALDGLAAQSARRQQATADAAAAVTYAQQVITDTDAALAAFLQPSGNGEAPLLTAVRYERLDRVVADRGITHVLYVNLDAVAADAVSRQSLLGTSGQVSFLSAGNASWLLLDTASGAVVGGGQESLANVTTFSLEKRSVEIKPVEELPDPDLGNDRLNGLEFWAKLSVALFAFPLAALGVISFIAVVRIAFSK